MATLVAKTLALWTYTVTTNGWYAFHPNVSDLYLPIPAGNRWRNWEIHCKVHNYVAGPCNETNTIRMGFFDLWCNDSNYRWT